MKDSVTIHHKGNLAFEVNVNGHKMMIDSSESFGGNNRGPRPKSLMLVAIAGCTGMDMASLLTKMRVGYEDIQVKVEGNITEEHPKHFDQMHLTYIIRGKNIDRDKVEKAIQMSQEKYCGVSYTYRQSITITHELIIEE